MRLTERATVVLHRAIVRSHPLSHGCAVPALHLRRKFDLSKSKIWNLIYQRESQEERQKFAPAHLPLPMGEVAAVRLTERATVVLHRVIVRSHPLSHGCAVPAPRLRRKFDLSKSKIWNLIYQRGSQEERQKFAPAHLPPPMGEVAAVRLTERATVVLHRAIIQHSPHQSASLTAPACALWVLHRGAFTPSYKDTSPWTKF